MQKALSSAAILVIFSIGGFPAQAALTVVGGKVVATYADPDDFVIELDVAGVCGSKFFHIQRAKKNFKELTAAALVAVAGGKHMNLFVESCVADRNILSHGAVFP